MAAIHLRQDKERPLTIEEVDHNFDAINREVGDKLDTTSFNATNILELLDGNAGAGSTLDADKVHGKYPTTAATANTVMLRDGLGNTYVNQIYGLHVGNVVGNVVGNLTGTVTGNASNVDGVVQIEHGGTGAVTASAARQNLGCGNVATQNKNAIDITGGTITGITDLLIADGGTGASTASGARTNLGLVIGADIQAYNATLSGISATTGDGFLIRTASNSAVVRKFVPGNSIIITNADGTGGDITVGMDLNPTVTSIQKSGTSGSGDIGSSSNKFGTIYGSATSAKYADLAEKYSTDKEYPSGTVIVVSLDDNGAEGTACFQQGQRVLGVVSEKPAFLMNEEAKGQALALRGRVPVKIAGPVKKGQALITGQDGNAIVGDTHNSFAIALHSDSSVGVKLVECVIL